MVRGIPQTTIDIMAVDLTSMSVAEVAKKNGVSMTTIYNLQKCGALPACTKQQTSRPDEARPRNKQPAATPSTGPSSVTLPAFPALDPNWPCSTQVAWLGAYVELKKI